MITIEHTHLNGTVIRGSTKGDGVYEIVKKRENGGFGFHREPGIYIKGSRDKNAQTWRIDAAKRALEAAGFEVTVQIENTPRPTAEVEADRAERGEARADRLAERAGKAMARSNDALSRARGLTDGIPFGQPMQHPSHHSYKADRNRRERADQLRARSYEEGRKAEHLASRSDGVVANQQHRENPRVTMRRIEKLEAEARDIQRNLDGYSRNSYNGKGEVVYVEKHEPATGEWREQLTARAEHVAEQIAHWQAQLDAKAESGEFVPWGREHFVRGDQVRLNRFGDWYTVTRVNAKSVSVHNVGWPHTIPWDDVAGRRRDGMQWDTPNGDPWPVELAKKVERWRTLQQWRGAHANDYGDDTTRKRIKIEFAQRLAHGLDLQASDAEVQAFHALVNNQETFRQVAAAYVDIYDRLAGGEKVADVQANITPLELTPEWRMPDREPEGRRAGPGWPHTDRPLVQVGDLIVGVYERHRGDQRLLRNFTGPVTAVSEVLDRRERGQFITITLADGTSQQFDVTRWLAVHPAGTWETSTPAEPAGEAAAIEAASDAVDRARDARREAFHTCDPVAIDAAGEEFNRANEELTRTLRAVPELAEILDRTAPAAQATDDEPDPWGPLLDEIEASLAHAR